MPTYSRLRLLTSRVTRALCILLVISLTLPLAAGCDQNTNSVMKDGSLTPTATNINTVSVSATPTLMTIAQVTQLASIPTPAATSAWDSLRRPLHLPTLTSGTPCPISKETAVNPAFGPGLGEGPVYPIQSNSLKDLPMEGDWHTTKLLWVSHPDYDSPALVRVHQLDGPNDPRFRATWSGQELTPELQLGALGSLIIEGATRLGWRGWGSTLHLRSPGCYAYQIDGLDFSNIVVFSVNW